MAGEAFKIKPSTDPLAEDIAVDIGADGLRYQLEQPAFGPDGGVKVMVDEATGKRFPVKATETEVLLGDVLEAAPASDTASSGLNGRLQRLAQRLTTNITNLGDVAETAPASDTASSGLNGRLQRIAQRLTTLIGVEGDTADAVVAAGATGTLSAKLRRVTQGLEDLKTGIILAAGTAIIGRVLRAESSVTATIANAATVSGAVDIRGYSIIGIIMPATWTAATISFQVSHDNTLFQALYDYADVLISQTVTQARSYPAWGELAGWNYVKVVSSVAQGGSRDIILQLKA